MAFNRESALKLITERIAWLATLCDLRGAIHLFDAHTISHEFFCRLLNEIYDLKLVVLDRIQANFPAIDLGDQANKRSFQITSEKTSAKIETTLEKYAKHDLPNRYGSMQILIIGEKQSSYKSVTVPASMTFVPDKDIVDTKDLIRIIEGLSTEKLERIAAIVDAEVKLSDFPAQLYLHVSAYNDHQGHLPGSEYTRLTYLAEQEDGDIAIGSVMPYLNKVASGGPIEPLRYITATYCPFDWDFPALDFKLLNRTSKPFFLTEALFEIRESCLDPTPVVAVKEDVQQSFAGAFWLVNEGATKLDQVLVRYDLFPGRMPLPETELDSYPFSAPIGELDTQVEVRIDDAFAARGVDVQGLDTLLNVVDSKGDVVTVRDAAGAQSSLSRDEHEKAVKKSLGPFQDAVGTIIGEIDFVESSSVQKYLVRFRAVVFIWNVNRRGLPRPPSALYDVEFQPVGRDYRKNVPVSHELRPGEADRFLIRVAVSQSSIHQFRVLFRDIGGEQVISPWIRLKCFVPRTRRGQRAQKSDHLRSLS